MKVLRILEMLRTLRQLRKYGRYDLGHSGRKVFVIVVFNAVIVIFYLGKGSYQKLLTY